MAMNFIYNKLNSIENGFDYSVYFLDVIEKYIKLKIYCFDAMQIITLKLTRKKLLRQSGSEAINFLCSTQLNINLSCSYTLHVKCH